MIAPPAGPGPGRQHPKGSCPHCPAAHRGGLSECDPAAWLTSPGGVRTLPLTDVVGTALQRSESTTYCPYKGEANYYHVTAAGDTVDDVIWTYEQPYPAVGAIAGHVAFYADKADVVVA